MEIKWLGHSCFQIKTKDATLVTDPYSPEVGLQLPRLKADIVLLSHEHFDHNDLSKIDGEPLIFRTPGEFEAKGFLIKGIGTFHDASQGTERGKNTMFLIDAEGFRLLHSGDLGHHLLESTVEQLGSVDVLMITVGGTYTLGAAGAAAVAKAIEPRIIIPMHYLIAGLKLKIDGVEKFIKEIGLKVENLEKLVLNQRAASAEAETRLVVLSPAV